MVNMTLAIPGELHNRMKHFSDIKWTQVARKAIETRIKDLEALEKIVSKSRLTKKDVEEIGRSIKLAASKRFMKQ